MFEQKVRSLIALLCSLLEPGSSGMCAEFRSTTAYIQAREENLEVVVPERNQLFIDIDNDLGSIIYERNFAKFSEFYHVVEYHEAPSKSGTTGKKHITLTLEHAVEPTERLVLQAFLGSDLTREFLGLQRIKVSDPTPTLFLEKKLLNVEPAPIDDIPF